MKHDLEALRKDQGRLLAALDAAGADVRRANEIKCPFHEDLHPSAGVFAGEDGIQRFKCHAAGCGFSGDLFDVQAKASGRPLADVLRDATGGQQPARPATVQTIEQLQRQLGPSLEATYRYTDPATDRVDLVVFRYRKGEGKSFMQARPQGDGFVKGGAPKPWPIYNRSRILDADAVVVVEGEKAVHSLHTAGFTATTSPAGAGKAALADWSPLAGKRIWLWPDRDDGGVAHMREVKQILEDLNPAPRLCWIEPESLDLPPKGDAADFIERYDGADAATKHQAVQNVMRNASALGAGAGVEEHLTDVIEGRHRLLAWPWGQLTHLSRALLPGTVTLLCGPPGAGKSFFLMQAAAEWYGRHERVAVFMLEEDRTFHLNRALCQVAGNSKLIDDAWIRENPDDVREAFSLHEDFLNEFGRCITSAPDHQVTMAGLAEWVERKAAAGFDLIAADPLTVIDSGDKPWIRDCEFLVRAKAAIRKSGSRLLLTTHPKKQRGTSVDLDQLAGGAAFGRLSQCVLWLHAQWPPKEFQVSTPFGPSRFEANRTVKILKARNGRGVGIKLAFGFDGQTFRFREYGAIVPEQHL